MNGPEQRDQREEMKDKLNDPEMNDPRMQEFEQTLSRAMQRVEVRAETSAKLLALAAEAERNRVHAGGGFRWLKLSNGGRVFTTPRLPQTRAWMGGAIAAVLALGVFFGTHIHDQHEQHERRAAAEHQFETAERITDETLARTREQLEQRGINLEQQ